MNWIDLFDTSGGCSAGQDFLNHGTDGDADPDDDIHHFSHHDADDRMIYGNSGGGDGYMTENPSNHLPGLVADQVLPAANAAEVKEVEVETEEVLGGGDGSDRVLLAANAAEVKEVEVETEEVLGGGDGSNRVLLAANAAELIANDAPFILSKAIELFVMDLTMRSSFHMEEVKRKTIQKNDIVTAVSQNEMFDFLVDIVPRPGYQNKDSTTTTTATTTTTVDQPLSSSSSSNTQ
eukprot:gene15007-17745_t